jgi:hypothetical protein
MAAIAAARLDRRESRALVVQAAIGWVLDL